MMTYWTIAASRTAARLLCCTALSTCVMVAAPAVAQARSAISISAQPASEAIKQLAKQTGTQILFDYDKLRGVRSHAVEGAASPLAALQAMLRGTGFEVGETPSGALMVRPSREAPGESVENAAAGGEGEEAADAAAIVVTGSRIARATYNTPSPIAITSKEDIERSGKSNLYEVLRRSPQFGVGNGPTNDGGASGSDFGAQFVNLRGLGSERTLVLVDGRRRVSGGSTFAAVDLGSIPANIVERTEVVTGGSAAVYGADAVSGVVNVILREDVDGLELNMRQALSDRGDAYSYSYGGLFGGDVGTRGHVTIGVSYNHDSPLSLRDRGAGHGIFMVPNPVNADPKDGVPDNVPLLDYGLLWFPYGGSFKIGALPRMTFENGALRPVRPGRIDPVLSSVFSSPDDPLIGFDGGDGDYPSDFLNVREKYSSLATLTHFTYDLTDSIKLASNLQFGQTRARYSGSPDTDFFVIRRENPLLPAPVANLMDQNGLAALAVPRANVDQGLPTRFVTRTTYTGTVSLEGEVGDALNWQAFGQYGRFDARDIFRNERIVSRRYEAVDVIADPVTGRPVCRSADARAAGCQPLNIFGSDAATTDAIGYFTHDPVTLTTNTQVAAGAQLSGNVFDMPGGSVKFASGVEYRRETIDVSVDPLAQQGKLLFPHGGPIKANFDVKEVFGEVVVPLLKGHPLAETLELDGALRYSDYSNGVHSTTWKAGLIYAPVSDIRIRVTRSRSVRAPNLNELYTPGVGSIGVFEDPCSVNLVNATQYRAANCVAQGAPSGLHDDSWAFGNKVIVNRGNADLEPETADSLTLGMIVEPRIIPGLHIAVDYFDMNLRNAIKGVDMNSIFHACYDTPTPAANACDLIERGQDGIIDTFYLSPINIGKLRLKGIDVALDYRRNAGSLWQQPLTLWASLAANFNLKSTQTPDQTQPGNVLISHNTPGIPAFRGSLTFGAYLGKWNASWNFEYINRTRFDPNASKETYAYPFVASRLINNLNVSYDVSDRARIGFGINNVFDVSPPINVNGAQGGSGLYDYIGRYLFMTANIKI